MKAAGEKRYTVSEMIRLFGITRKTLFYYDHLGLLKPISRIGSQQTKVYDQAAAERLRKIIQYRVCGIHLKEIRILLEDEAAAKDILQEVRQRQMQELVRLQLQFNNLEQLIASLEK